ncbi:MAG: hypothetical protein HOI23_06500 [Deltaproteobacteria bacterium]|jgi:hypothetical protein|nr:hypothetical protein [Deltaproteobacteria bacterium]MBT6431889.1 hypothetical protein [Deltaproteobacteria bacterium]
MTRGARILAIVMGLSGLGSMWAAQSGIGLSEPTREALSVREDSKRTNKGRRYFHGGGHHRGK